MLGRTKILTSARDCRIDLRHAKRGATILGSGSRQFDKLGLTRDMQCCRRLEHLAAMWLRAMEHNFATVGSWLA
jgi:hypothetical protein